MIDTIKVSKELTSEEKGIIINNPEIKDMLFTRDGEIKECRIRNAQMRFRGHYLHLLVSLPTFKYGHNLLSLKYWSLSETVEAIEEVIGIKLKEATVNRIDIAQTIVLERKCADYINRLMYKNGFNKHEYSHGRGVNFLRSDNSRVLAFYDKTKHYASSFMKKMGKYIIDEFNGKNLLRYEMRMPIRLHHQMNRKLQIRDLFDKSIYNTLVIMWQSEYFGITKSKVEIEFKAFASPGELKDYLAFKGATTYGESNLSKLIETVWKDKDMENNAVIRHRATKMVNSLFRNVNMSREDDCIKELNSRIIEASHLAYC